MQRVRDMAKAGFFKDIAFFRAVWGFITQVQPLPPPPPLSLSNIYKSVRVICVYFFLSRYFFASFLCRALQTSQSFLLILLLLLSLYLSVYLFIYIIHTSSLALVEIQLCRPSGVPLQMTHHLAFPSTRAWSLSPVAAITLALPRQAFVYLCMCVCVCVK